MSGGIPFPEGKYKDYKAFSLYDGTTEIPVQVSPIVKYPDGSLHWGLVCFPVSMGAKSKKVYILKDTPGKVQPANPVVVKETGDIVQVSNGIVSFTVNRANFNGFESIKLGGQEVFKSAKAWLLANNQGGPAKPTHFDFVYRGPVRTTLYIKGPCGEQKTPTFAVAITLCAGEPVIRIEHNLRNGGIGVKRIDVVEPRFCLGGASEFKTGSSGRGNGPKASYGWQEFNGPADIMVFLRHGGTSHAGGKDLVLDYSASVTSGELVVNLAMVRGKPTRLEEGEHKISEIALVFNKSFSPEAILAPLHALASCSYYAQHDSMGVGRGFGSLEDETSTYKSAGWKKYDDPKKMPSMKPAPDLWYNWLDVHETSECDQIQGMIFGYIRTGQRGYLDHAMAWQRYYRAFYMYRTDDFTYGKEGRRGGLEKFGGGRTCAGGCHTYGVGIFNYALLTGNIDALEAAFDLAEQCNAIAGTYSKIKPGAELGFWGSRGFVRNFLAVARAYDVARTPEWEERLVHFVNSAATASDRDPRGFINHGYVSAHPQKYIDDMAKHGTAPEAVEMQTKEGVTLVNNKLTHPKYGSWNLKQFGSWPEAMEATAHLVSYEALSTSTNPISQLAADDAMDLAIVKAELGLHYAFDPVQKAVYYYMFIDYPIPGYAPLWKGGKWKERIEKGGSDSWYTKWWPNPMAGGYLLTGDKRMLERCFEVLWWRLSRNYINPPVVPEGEAPPYARIDTSTKNDWMTTTALAFGICARPKKDELSPVPITDLAARSLGGGKVELTWKAPVDKGGGKVVRYQLKYAELPIDDYPVDGEYWRKNWKDGNITVTYWNMAKNVLGEPVPSTPGATEKMTVNLPAGKKLWLGVRSFDDSHNRSALSNIVEIDVK